MHEVGMDGKNNEKNKAKSLPTSSTPLKRPTRADYLIFDNKKA